ncbi:MAG: hypothetical protein GF320_20530 [Armatimonadia bacterium]|nr:hypothetical protein [Armatimonadia bacterium]
MIRRILTSKVIAFLIGFVGVPTLIAVRVMAMSWDLDDLKHTIETEAAFHLNRTVQIGAIEGNPLTGIVLRDVTIAQRGRSLHDDPFVHADTIRVKYRGQMILDREVLPLRGIDLVEITGLDAEVSRDAQGDWNFQDLIPEEKEETPDRFAGTIRVTDGRVHYRDETVVTPRGVLDITPDDIDLQVDLSDHTKITLLGSLSGGSEPISRIGVDGEIGLGEASYQTFGIDLDGVDLPYAVSYLDLPPDMLGVTGGWASGEAKLALAGEHDPVWSVRAGVRAARIASPQYIQGEAVYTGPLKVVGTSLFFEGATIEYGSSVATVHGSLLGLGAPTGPLYDVTLTDARLDPAELLAEWPVLPEDYELTTSGPLTGDLLVTGSGTELVVEGDLSSPGVVAELPQGIEIATDDIEVDSEVGDLEAFGGEVGVAETGISVSTGPLFEPPDWMLVDDTSLGFEGRVAVGVEIGEGGVTGRARLHDGHVRFLGTRIDSLIADTRFDASGVEITALSARLDGSPLQGSGWLEYGDGPLAYEFSGLLESFPISSVARYLDVGETVPRGELFTRLEVTSPTEPEGSPTVVLKGRVEDVAYGSLTAEEAIFAARTAEGRLEIPWLEVADSKAAIQAAGDLVYPTEEGDALRLADTRVVVEDADVAALLAALQPPDAEWPELGGRASFVGQLSGPISSPFAYGTLEVEEPAYDRWSADHLRIGTLSADMSEITLADLHLSRGLSSITANGTISDFVPEGEEPVDPRLDLLVHADRLDVEDALSLAEVPNEQDLSGLVYVQASVQGPLSDLSGQASIEARDTSAAGWPIREASVDVSLSEGDLEFQDLRAAVDPGGISAQGIVHDVMNTRYLEVTWTADDLALDAQTQEWAQRYGLGGAVSLSGTFDGPIEDFEAQLFVETEDLVVGGQSFKQGSAQVQATRFSSSGLTMVDFGPVVLEGAGGLVRVAGFWDSKAGAINASMDAAGLELEALADLLEAWSDDPTGMAPISRAASTLGGELYGEINLDGQPGSLYMTGTGLRLREATYRGESLPVVTGTVTWDQRRNRVYAPEFAIIDESGIVEGRLDAHLGEDGAIEGEIEGRDVPLAHYASLLGTDLIDDGSGAFHLVIHGATTAPDVSGSITVSDLALALPESLHGSLGERLEYERLSFQGLSLGEGALSASRILLGSDERGLRLEDLRLPFSYREGGLLRDRPIAARLSLPRQDVSDVRALRGLLRRWGVTGGIEMDIAVAGTLARPSFDGFLVLEDGRAVYAADNGVAQRLLGGAPLIVEDVDVRVVVAPGQDSELGRITLEQLEGDVLGGSFSLDGGISLVGWSPLDRRNRFDLSAEITGISRRLFPGPDGVMDLRRAAVSVVYQPDTGVNTVRLDEVDVGLGTGRITAGGEVSLTADSSAKELGYNPWDAWLKLDSLHVNARDLAEFAIVTLGGDEDADLSYLDVGHGVLDGSITIENRAVESSLGGPRRNPAHVSGEITLHHAELTIPTALPSGGEAALWTMEREDFFLDLTLSVGDGVNVPLLGAPLEGSATVSGSLRQPTVSGEFSAAAGEIGVLGRIWDIDRLSLGFQYKVASNRELQFEANLDIQAGTYVPYRGRNIRVLLTISGPLGATEIELSSDPPIPESELITLIGSGGGEEAGGGGASAVGDALSSDLSAALGGLVGEQAVKGLVGQIQSALGLEQFEIEIGENAELTGFDVESEVLPNLFIRVRQINSQDFDEPEIRFGITYKLPGKGRFSLETTDTGELQASLEASWSL